MKRFRYFGSPRRRPEALLFFVILGMFFFASVVMGGPINWPYFVIHFLIIGLSLLHIAKLPRFNLGASFSFFALFFFGIIPLLEYQLHITYHGASIPRDSSYLTAAGLALLSSIFFYTGYGLERHRWSNTYGLLRVQYVNRLHYQLVYLAAVIGVVTLPFYIAAYYGFEFNNLFFRGFAEQIESTPFDYSLINYFVRPLLFNLTLLVILVRLKRKLTLDGTAYVMCLLLVVLVSPVGISRSLAGALYVPLFILVFFPRFMGKYSILSIVIFLIVVAAPVADVFRLIHQAEGINLLQNFNFDYFFAGHFDAFHNLVQVVELNFSSKGWQVIGALLFWIPRSIWPGKPVGTNFEFAEFAGFRSENISFSLPAELFADFGVVGVIFGMFIFGVVYKRLDNVLSKPQKAGSLAAYIFAIGKLELAILGIYLLRGNFLSSLAFTAGVALTLIVLMIVNAGLRSVSTGIALALRPAHK